jgi:hypothetical protein
MSNEYALDVIIHFNVHSVKQLQGGFISYVARDADDEVRWFISGVQLLFTCFHEANVLCQIIAVSEVGHITSLLEQWSWPTSEFHSLLWPPPLILFNYNNFVRDLPAPILGISTSEIVV